MRGRLLLANLFAEDELDALRTGRKPPTPTREALRRAAALAPRLRVFAEEGDRLWAVGDPAPAPAAEVLAWCETPGAAALRTSPRPAGPLDLDAPLHELLWRLPVPDPATVARVHHRGFALETAEALGCALPGARRVESVSDLERHLFSGAAGASPGGCWVVKAPYSASGRSRHVETGGAGLGSPRTRRAVENLFERHGPLAFEPWMERTEDFGAVGVVTPGGARLRSFHRQRVDERGRFQGVELPAEFRGIEGVGDEERERIEEVFAGVAAALRRQGYVGPFGIDLWRYRKPDGAVALHPLGEINARMTMGLVERAWVDRFGRGGVEAPEAAARVVARPPRGTA